MSKFHNLVALIWRGGGGRCLIIAVAAIAIAAALLSGAWHSQAHADSPTPAATRASQPSGDVSQALRRYTLQLLHILSAPDANQWQRYRHAIPHCDAAPTYLAEIVAAGDVRPLDATLIALTEDLCADLDQRLEDARTVGLLVNEPESMDGYVLIPGRFNNNVHLIDHLGRIVNEWRFENYVPHAKLLDNGNLLAELRDGSGRGGLTVGEVDPNGNIVWKYTHHENLHHDFIKMPNGNVLMLANGLKTFEEAVAAGVNPNIVPSGGMVYDYLIEMRPSGSEGGEIVWEWSTWDYIVQNFDPTKSNYGSPSEHPELIDVNFLTAPLNSSEGVWSWWGNVNAIDYNPELDQIALSSRYYNELWIIDRSVSTEEAPTRKNGNAGKGGALLYRWGNPQAYGHGTIADRQLFRQHHTQWIAPGLPGAGNILIFNNGHALEEDQSRNYSSIEEIVPPVDGYGYRREPGTAYTPSDPVWTYTVAPPTDFYSSIMSGVQRLPNGNTLICDATSGNLFQVTPDGKTVWQYVYPMDGAPLKQGAEASVRFIVGGDDVLSNTLYRAFWYPPNHPGLQHYDLTPGDTIELYE